MSTSQNGWTAGRDAAPFVVAGVSFPQGVTPGDAATVLRYVAEQFHRRVERLHGGWCWGYAYRDVRGSSGLSNHASGTAIDVNAPDHPLGTSPSSNFSRAQIDTIHTILREVDGTVRWGGNYTGRQDPMHFEINVSASRLAPTAARIRGGVTPSEEDDLQPDERQALLDIRAQLTGSQKPGEFPGWPTFTDPNVKRTLVDYLRDLHRALAEATIPSTVDGKNYDAATFLYAIFRDLHGNAAETRLEWLEAAVGLIAEKLEVVLPPS